MLLTFLSLYLFESWLRFNGFLKTCWKSLGHKSVDEVKIFNRGACAQCEGRRQPGRGWLSSPASAWGALAHDKTWVPCAGVLDLTQLRTRFGPEPADVGGSCVPSSMGAGSGFKGTWFSWEVSGGQRHWFAGVCMWAHGVVFMPFPTARRSLTSRRTSVPAKLPPPPML